jgi:protein-L-isoaspartate(D-aspartate) O-methyltransferase
MEISTDTARFNMIQQQVRPWDVFDEQVLETMQGVPRELFVPDAYRGLAYADVAIPIGGGQQMLEPRIVGRLLQALRLTPADKVLQIGAGTGYVTACIARLGGSVICLELQNDLTERARANLAALAIANADIRTGDGLSTPPSDGPFDAIALTGSLPTTDGLDTLTAQLKLGGRLFAVVGEDPVMEALLIERLGEGGTHQRRLFETSVPSLVNAPQPRRFVF